MAAFLTDGFRVPTEAVPATLLDLAARRLVEVEQVGPATAVRDLPARQGAPLAPYEARVLGHVRSVAMDGLLPAEALTTGPEALSQAWWRGFRGEVTAEARARGLSRPRWTGWHLTLLWGGVGATGACLWFSVKVGPRDLDAIRPTVELGVAVLLFLAALGAVRLLTTAPKERETPAGLAAAARWLGVRRHLARDPDLEDQPPGAVVIGGRPFAYAAAMGLAPAAVRGLPLGREDDHEAWSRQSGRWRRGHVRYPRVRPGYGLHPGVAVGAGLIRGGFAAVVGWIALDLARTEPVLPSGAGRWATLGAILVGLSLLAVAAWNAVVLLLGIGDLFATGEVRGVVLRRRAFSGTGSQTQLMNLESLWRNARKEERRLYVAIDTGEGGTIDAWRVRPPIHDRVSQGATVRAMVTPRLRYVRAIEPA